MARIEGVDLPRNKRIEIALTYIYGIGKPNAQDVLATAGVDASTKVKDLTEAEVIAIRDSISADYREYQTADRDWLLSRPAAPYEPASARAAHAHKRTNA